MLMDEFLEGVGVAARAWIAAACIGSGGHSALLFTLFGKSQREILCTILNFFLRFGLPASKRFWQKQFPSPNPLPKRRGGASGAAESAHRLLVLHGCRKAVRCSFGK